MIQLTANLSDGLVELIQAQSVRISAVEVGPWFSIEQIQQYQQQLPGWKFHLHYGNLISRLRWLPGTYGTLQAYIQCTSSPWLSFHLSLLPPGYAWLGRRFGLYLPLPRSARSFQWFVDGVSRVKSLNLPVVLENMPSFRTDNYAFEISAENIAGILDLTDTGFLLDIAHARVVASVFGLDVYEYLDSLPLERVRQIHTSGPRARKGVLYDAHEDLQEEDFELLKWVLMRTKSEVVTLEYFRDKEKLCDQLLRIEEILEAAQGQYSTQPWSHHAAPPP